MLESTQMSSLLDTLGVNSSESENYLLGKSSPMQEVFNTAKRLAETDITVLIRGESGCGKEIVGRLIHYFSARSDKPFVAINCAALSETMLESELFGHEKGAFTGATVTHKGRFERANGGTLFLDEIGDTTLAFQMKLLRVLQEREFERVGGKESIKINVRIIAATNRDLEAAIPQGRFRLDLYYRLNAMEIYIPPLRERSDDVPFLVDRILKKRANQIGLPAKCVSMGALKLLSSCKWPGNVRELENCLMRASIRSNSTTIDASDLCCMRQRCSSRNLWNRIVEQCPVGTGHGANATSHLVDPKAYEPLAVVKLSKETLLDTLRKEKWVQTRAARALGLTPRQIGYALRRFNITVKP